jgi:hypothetical protein
MNRPILPRPFRKGGAGRQFPQGTAALIFRKARNAFDAGALFRRSRTPLTPRIARLIEDDAMPASSSFFCGCFQTLDPLPHPAPSSLLERLRIPPRIFLFGGGHLLRPRPVPGEHLRRPRVDLGTRDETRPEAALPKHPQQRAPDRARCRGDDDPDQCLFDGIHASAGNTLGLPIILKTDIPDADLALKKVR